MSVCLIKHGTTECHFTAGDVEFPFIFRRGSWTVIDVSDTETRCLTYEKVEWKFTTSSLFDEFIVKTPGNFGSMGRGVGLFVSGN